MKSSLGWKVKIKVKLGRKDAHYSGGLVAVAKILEFFGDAATKLCLREAGVEGLLRAYREVEFLRPVFVGDTVEAMAKIVKIGKTSRTMKFWCSKRRPQRQIVCSALGTVVIPQRSGSLVRRPKRCY